MKKTKSGVVECNEGDFASQPIDRLSEEIFAWEGRA